MDETIDDLTAPWMGAGVELATRMLALADEFEDVPPALGAAEMIREVIRCEYNPLPPVRPELGDPPTLRPAVPAAPEPGS